MKSPKSKTPDAQVAAIDEAAHTLYGQPPSEFVKARDALAKEYRAAGDKELAAEVKALRKPTVVADALNRALRHDPTAVDSLLAVAEDLRRTQEAMLAGPSADFAQHQTAYRQALDAIVDAVTTDNAATLDTTRLEVRAGLEAAVLSGADQALRRAAFATVPEPSGGLGPFAFGAGSTPAFEGSARTTDGSDRIGQAQGQATGTDRAQTDPAEIDRAQVDEVRAQARKRARRAVTEAEATCAAAKKRVARATGAVTEIETRVEAAKARVAELTESRDEATGTLREAEAKAAAAEDSLETARAALAQLEAE